jgi:hypothetical protein
MFANDDNSNNAIGPRFVGRQDVLKVFYQLVENPQGHNAVYYFAKGGVGKTWLLRKILEDNLNKSDIRVTGIIDFFNTHNQNILGLRKAIKETLVKLGYNVFKPYDEALALLEDARSRQIQAVGGGELNVRNFPILANLEGRANKIFFQCIQHVPAEDRVVLLFDTFERVQHRHVGQWVVNDLLSKAKNLFVAIAGRPHTIIEMPESVIRKELGGLAFEDIHDYVVHKGLAVPDDIMADELLEIWKLTNGIPLYIDLYFDRIYRRGYPNPYDPDWLKYILEDFAQPKPTNRIIWSMTVLKRRFNIEMLDYILDSNAYPNTTPLEREEIIFELGRHKFVKLYSQGGYDTTNQLLHDAVQEFLEANLLDDIDSSDGIRDVLYRLIVDEFYNAKIDEATDSRLGIADLLKAERFGYLLDAAIRQGNTDSEIQFYSSFRDEIDDTYNYDFEDLLWGEIHDHLEKLPKDRAYDIALDRGKWLMKRSLFGKAEAHYKDMCHHFADREVDINTDLGFVLLRRGKLEDAVSVLEKGRQLAEKQNDYIKIAQYENTLGQVKRAAGQWDEALEHYSNSEDAFTSTTPVDEVGIAGVCSNRGYLYALMGMPSDAHDECERALNLLRPLYEGNMGALRPYMYANINMGTVHRHAKQFDEAKPFYTTTLELAEFHQDQEVISYTSQDLGINLCLQGRKRRRDGWEILLASQEQLQAFQHVAKGLEIAGRGDYRAPIYTGLSRMARVYEEIYELLALRQSPSLISEEVEEVLQELEGAAKNFQPPAEVDYQEYLTHPQPFSQLDWLGKAARLFELSALVAEEVHDLRGALDGWAEFATLLIKLGQYDDVHGIIQKLKNVRGAHYQHVLFDAIAQIILAELEFAQGNLDVALEKFAKEFGEFGSESGYPSYMLRNYLEDLDHLIRSLPSKNLKTEWCNTLKEFWREKYDLQSKRPEMFRILQGILLDVNRSSAE